MNTRNRSLLIERANRILTEFRLLKDACAAQKVKSRELMDAAQFSIEEAMILKEEAHAAKCERLAIVQLITEDAKPDPGSALVVSVDEERRTVQKNIEEIRRTPLSDDNQALQSLRTMFRSLSFLPNREA